MNLLLALAVAAQLTSAKGGDFLLQTGDRAPPFAMRDLDRNMFSIAHHAGAAAKEPRKAILMVFFATWCEPCKKEIPIVKDLHQRWKDKGVEVIYVGLSQGAKELGPFALEQKLPWRVIPDSFGLLARRYGARELPHLLIVDNAAKIAFQHRGIAPNLRAALDNQLARVTGEPVPQGAIAETTEVSKPRFDTTYQMGRPPSDAGSAGRWQPLAMFVGEKIKANVEMATEDSYETYENALKEGKFAIANAGPMVCQRVSKFYEPVARIERQGTPNYLGIVFAKRVSGLRQLKQLKGKTIGLVAEHSSSGGLYPQLALIEAGLVPGKDVTIKWLGSHAKVAKAVHDGSVDAGGCYEDCRDVAWPNEKLKGIATKILAYTREIPSEMIVVKRDLDPEIREKIQSALLELNNEQALLTQISQSELTITALTKASGNDLDPVRKVMRQVKRKTR